MTPKTLYTSAGILPGMTYDADLVERLREALAGTADVHERAMFGGRAFFVNGNMAVTASSRGGLMVRADPAEVPALLEQPHTEPFQMHGRSMKGWVHVDLDGVDTESALKRWVATGITYARSLPPK